MTEKGFAEWGYSTSITISSSLCSALLVNPARSITKDKAQAKHRADVPLVLPVSKLVCSELDWCLCATLVCVSSEFALGNTADRTSFCSAGVDTAIWDE